MRATWSTKLSLRLRLAKTKLPLVPWVMEGRLLTFAPRGLYTNLVYRRGGERWPGLGAVAVKRPRFFSGAVSAEHLDRRWIGAGQTRVN